jgi:quercetin dioxygenase-like cupin family protein
MLTAVMAAGWACSGGSTPQAASGSAAPPAAAAAAAPSAEGPAPARHHFVPHGAGKMYPRDLVSTELKLSGEITDGRYNFIDEIWKPGFVVRPHFHVEHSELFYLLVGQVEWTVGGETHTLGAGDAVFIPPDTVHAVKVVGDTDVRTLMIYEPGDYEEHLDEEQQYTPAQRKEPDVLNRIRANFDFNLASPEVLAAVRPAAPLSPGTRHPSPSVRLVATAPQTARPRFAFKGKGEIFAPDRESSEVKLSAADTDGRFSFLDELWRPGMAVPPHFHKRHAETFFVISGQVEWTVGGETRTLGAGDLVYIPPDTVHTVKVVGDRDVQSLMLYEPGGYEYHSRREAAYTPAEQQQPEVRQTLRRLNDFNPVTP